MMKQKLLPYILLFPGLLLTGACHTARLQGPAPATVYPKQAVTQTKKALTPPKLSAQQLPQTLGGLVQSDSWIIYKDKQQEEFSGNVSYDNGAYIFKADYALSDRAKNTFSARGHVFLRQNNPDGSFYQGQADRGWYNYKTQKGALFAEQNQPVRLVYHNEKGQQMTATSRKVNFDLNQKIYVLEKDVHLEQQTAQGTQTITAQKATLKQTDEYILLEGKATISDGKRTLLANTFIYDKKNNVSYAYGGRPMAYGETDAGTFAVIADQLQADAQGEILHLEGNTQGWFVSPQINNSDINKKF